MSPFYHSWTMWSFVSSVASALRLSKWVKCYGEHELLHLALLKRKADTNYSRRRPNSPPPPPHPTSVSCLFLHSSSPSVAALFCLDDKKEFRWGRFLPPLCSSWVLFREIWVCWIIDQVPFMNRQLLYSVKLSVYLSPGFPCYRRRLYSCRCTPHPHLRPERPKKHKHSINYKIRRLERYSHVLLA